MICGSGRRACRPVPPPESPCQSMIELYTFTTPNGRKPAIMLEEVGLPYSVHPIHIGRDEQFAPDFLKISPNNKIPAIVDTDGPDGAPISVFESGAILIYLAEKTGKLLPTDPRGRTRTMEWLMFQMASIGPMLGPGRTLHPLRAGEGALWHQALHRRDAAAARGDGPAARRGGVSGRRLLDRRHRHLSVDPGHRADGDQTSSPSPMSGAGWTRSGRVRR